MYKHFPIFLNLEEKNILLVGAGKIGLRRLKSLLPFACRIHVVSKEIFGEMSAESDFEAALLKHKNCRIERREFRWQDLDGADIVLAATGDEELNHRIIEMAKSKGKLCNNASCKEDCDFYFPALVESDGILIGVGSDGEDHKRVKALAERIREDFS